jgi:hypothetical protein
MDFDDRFLDVDFEKCPEYVFGDLPVAALDELMCGPSYESLYGVMSESEIDGAIEAIDAAGGGADRLVIRIYDQGREGSCVANAWAQANEIIQAKQFGIANVIPLSAMSLYQRIGRSASSGANVADGGREMNTRGILPLDTPENRKRFKHVMPNTGFRNPRPDGWEETGVMFAGVEMSPLRSVEGYMTALCNLDPVIVGRAGHSICQVRPMGRGRRNWKSKYANSWKHTWGDNGFGYDTMRLVQQSARYCFALRTTRVPTWRFKAA